MQKDIYWKVGVGDTIPQREHIIHINLNQMTMGFNQLLKKIVFPFLNTFGFILKDEQKGIVEYEQEYLRISLTYDYRNSYEVDVNFLFKANNQSYTYAELKENLIGKKNEYKATQISSGKKLEIWIIEVKSFLENYLQYILKNHIQISVELDSLREQRVFDYSNDLRKKYFEEDINKLWADKDYMGLVGLAKSYKGKMNNVLQKKYEYALKKIRPI